MGSFIRTFDLLGCLCEISILIALYYRMKMAARRMMSICKKKILIIQFQAWDQTKRK